MNNRSQNNKREIFYPLFYTRWWVTVSLRSGSPQRVKSLIQKVFDTDYYPRAAVWVLSLLGFITTERIMCSTASWMQRQNPIAPQHCQQRHYSPAVSSPGASPTAAL